MFVDIVSAVCKFLMRNLDSFCDKILLHSEWINSPHVDCRHLGFTVDHGLLGSRDVALEYLNDSLRTMRSQNRMREVNFESCFNVPPRIIINSGMRGFKNLRTVQLVNCLFFNPANIVTLDYRRLHSHNIQDLWYHSHPKVFAPHARLMVANPEIE